MANITEVSKYNDIYFVYYLSHIAQKLLVSLSGWLIVHGGRKRDSRDRHTHQVLLLAVHVRHGLDYRTVTVLLR